MLRYSDLFAYDADGRQLSARMQVVAGAIRLVIDDHGASYPVVVDPLIWVELAKLVASDGATEDWFGRAASVSGDTADRSEEMRVKELWRAATPRKDGPVCES